MMKKGIKIVAICVAVLLWIFFILYIIGVLVEKGVLGQEKDEPEITVKYKHDPKQEMSREEDIPDSEYQDTLQKALEEGRTDLEEETEYQTNVDEVIMSLENEEYISVFFRSVKDKDQECFTMAKFRKKDIGGETKYFFISAFPRETEREALYLDDFKEIIGGNLALSDYMQSVNINPTKGRFIYGENRHKEIYGLEVEGQRPTEIIPYKVFGEQWYFWYYENLESDKAGSQLEYTY